VNGHRTVRIATFGLLALGLSLVVSASSRASDPGNDLYISLSGPASVTSPGGPYTITATVDNSTGGPVNSYSARIALPDAATSDISSGDGCTYQTDVTGRYAVCDRSTPVANGGQDVFAFTVNIGTGAPSSVTFTPSVVNFNPTGITGNGDGLTIPVTEADLAVSSESASPSSSPGVTAGDAVAGGTIDYTIGVDNSAGPSDGQSFTLQDVLPHGATLVTGSPTTSGCQVTAAGDATHGQTVQCPGGALAAGTGTASFTIRAKVASSEPANSTYKDAVSLLSQVPSDPNALNDKGSVSVNLVTRADLVAGTLTASPTSPSQTLPLFANDTASQNAVTYTFTFTNTGPSYARNVKVTDVLNSGKLVGINYGFCETASCTPTNFSSSYPSNGSLALGDVADGTQVTVVIHAKADSNFRNLSNTAASALTSATASSDTTDPTLPPGNETASDSTVTIASRPSPVRGVQAIPGNGSAIVTWQTPQYTGGNALLTGTTGLNQAYRITLVPAGGGSPIFVATSAPQVTCPNDPTASNCYRINIPTGTAPALSNNTTYTVQVQAQNNVDFSDVPSPATTVRPSKNAAASIVLAAGGTLSTCTVATPLPLGQPVFVSFTVPGGGTGGVFGTLGGSEVGIPDGFCGVDANNNPVNCSGTTASSGIGPLSAYLNPKNPIKETILWDSSTIPASALKAPACGANKTIITCFPNNVLFYDEMSVAFPAFPATAMNGPGSTHFCADPLNKGGAGNVAWARPKPPLEPGTPKPEFSGYADSAGSACIASMTVLTGQPGRDAQKGDVQVVLNFTSDSDIIQGKR
jgi:uncharacterized repeat protein (TIGR01451 family)